MSGPKVVRIVTREEVLELCQGQLARVDAALSEWVRIGQRNDCLDEEAHKTAQQRRDALAALIASDRFMDFQKQAPIEEAFLRNDIQSRLAIVAAQQSMARAKGRRNEEAGKSLVRRLQTLDIEVGQTLVDDLMRGDTEALSKGFALLGQQKAKGTSALAERLRDERVQTFAAWLAAQPPAPADAAIERLAGRIDELAPLVSADETMTWRTRLAEAEGVEPARRHLLLDGLEVATGRALTEARARHALLIDVQLLAAETKAAGIAASAGKAIGGMAVEELKSLQKQLTAALDAHRVSQAIAARRVAVLEGLTSLGYEVTEGMSTSFAENGQLVVRSAARPDYGVEVSAVGSGDRMQMRPVAFESEGEGPDPRQDRDAETIWCGDVTTLQARLAKLGGELTIERALAIGQTPLKRIASSSRKASRATAAPRAKSRTVR